MKKETEWQQSKAKVFWGEIAPCDHVLQIYENDDSFLRVLTDFVGEGINSGEGVIVIATQEHLMGLECLLESHGLNISALIANDTYIPLDAHDTLSKFMVNGWPDEELFNDVVTELILKAKKGNRKVRAFGEMVAILWAQGNSGATVNLEHLWNKFCEKEVLCLFCAYPKAGFTQDAHESILHICNSHSKMIKGSDVVQGEVFYNNIQSAAMN